MNPSRPFILRPVATTLLMVGVLLVGFVLLGAWFAVLGMAGPAVARWGERTRPPAPALVPAEQAAVTE